MRLLIIGGTGNISWRLTSAAQAEAWDVTVLNRGSARHRPDVGADATLHADIRDRAAVEAALGESFYDAVVDFLCYNGTQAKTAIDLFRARTTRYILISTTGIYDRAIAAQPLKEDAPRLKQGWRYAAGKLEAEDVFQEAWMQTEFPVTIVRPGHTYDVIIPEAVGFADWTNAWRILNSKPVIVHGDGTTPWTLTHSIDLANAIIELIKTDVTSGDAYHVTSDETYSWNMITESLYRVLNVEPANIIYRSVQQIANASEKLGDGIKGHKMWPDTYNNSKFKALCPRWQASITFADGLQETIAHYRRNPALMQPNASLDAVLDALAGDSPDKSFHYASIGQSG